MMRKWIMEFVLQLGRARWIIDNEGDPGFRIFGICVTYYKWDDTFIVRLPKEAEEAGIRLAEKRELHIASSEMGEVSSS
jgi:hypothetical protein